MTLLCQQLIWYSDRCKNKHEPQGFVIVANGGTTLNKNSLTTIMTALSTP